MTQSLTGRQVNFFGSERNYYSGISLNSGASWTFVNFSGTTTGFGAQGHEENNRFAIVSSGTSYMEWAWGSGATMPQAGEIWGGNAFTQDGVLRSGVWLRTNANSNAVQLWGW